VRDGAPRDDGDPPFDPASARGDAVAAAKLLAVDPHGLGGARLRGAAGPARDAWLELLKRLASAGAPWRRVPSHADAAQLLGGVDLAATLGAGRPVLRAGLLAEADGGFAVLAMAERLSPAGAAHVSQALDFGVLAVARDGVTRSVPARLAAIALDEGDADEAAPASLRDRLAFDLAFDGLRPVGGRPDGPFFSAPDAGVQAARRRLPETLAPDAVVTALVAAAEALGVASPRAAVFALRATVAAAALAGRAEATAEDAALAARLVLAHRATRIPAPPDAPEPEPEQPDATPSENDPNDDTSDPESDARLADTVIEAARAALPPGLLAQLAGAAARRGAAGGASGGAGRDDPARGRPVGARPGRPEGGARLSLIETLRAAAPWSALRRGGRDRAPGEPIVPVRREDFRIRRFRRPAETLTLFLVDASGSTAAMRLAEAKGAVETLLAESYVRRDRVALIVFRSKTAELALPPTRALARAKRTLAALPGGGGTPLAAALQLAATETAAALRRGWRPSVVLLTDGRANVALDGSGGRDRAMADAGAAARNLAALKPGVLLIDSGARPNPGNDALARVMGGRALWLPHIDAGAVATAARSLRQG
jgi:magnesium chelatase subunit D